MGHFFSFQARKNVPSLPPRPSSLHSSGKVQAADKTNRGGGGWHSETPGRSHPWYIKVVNEDKEPLNLATPWGFRGVNEPEEPMAGATPWGFKDVNEEPLAGATPWGLHVENVELVDEAAPWGRIPDLLKEETLNRATPWGLLERLRQGENEKKTSTGEPLEEEKSTREPLDEATPWGVRDIATPWDQSMPRNFEKIVEEQIGGRSG